jgi:SSS family solute:Na+ symporter
MMNAATTLLTVDVYGKYVNREAGDAQKMRFGRLAVVVLVAAAIGLALLTYTPERSNNFFLRVSAQLSYFTPGIMAAFLFGVTWPRAGARGAVAAMLLGPVYGLGMEWLLEHGWGISLNFLHRIGLTFLLCSLTLVLLAGGEEQARRRAGFEQIGAGVSLPSLAGKVGLFLGLQLLVLLSSQLTGLPAREVSGFGALAAFAVFVPGLLREGAGFWKSDLLYAGLLSAASTGVYYYFA